MRSDQWFVDERDFKQDCNLLARPLAEWIGGADGNRAVLADSLVSRFMLMYEGILSKIEEQQNEGVPPNRHLLRAAELGMRRLLDMAALNQRSAIAYVQSILRERAIGGLKMEGLVEDDEILGIINADRVSDLMCETDREQLKLPSPDLFGNSEYQDAGPNVCDTGTAWDGCEQSSLGGESFVAIASPPCLWPDSR